MNKIILEEIDSIIKIITSSDIYKEYNYLKDKLKDNDKVNDYIKEIKANQKLIVKKECLKEDYKELEDRNNYLIKELNMIPLYVEYTNIQDELNDLCQGIKIELDNYFNNIFN